MQIKKLDRNPVSVRSLQTKYLLQTPIHRAVRAGMAAIALYAESIPSSLYRAPNPLTHPVEASHTMHFHFITPHFYGARMLCLPIIPA